jgi:beta-lactamase regulating signal transducer with metallopeptidase domain
MTPALNAALLHFVWQGAAVFAALWIALFALRKRSANTRYIVSCAALAILVACPIVTTIAIYRTPAAAAPIAIPSWPANGSPRAPVPSWIVPVWASGVLLFSLRMAWACTQISALRRRATPASDALQSIAASLSRRLGISRCPRVAISAWEGGPSLVGWLRPVILFPAAAVAGLTTEQLEAVLAHELAHIRRHDYLVNCVQMAVETLLFYHPAVWWISTRVRHERELCCDDLAVRVCAAPLCYARALTVLEKMRASLPGPALAGTGGPLLYRIQRIVGAAAEPYGPSRLSGIAAAAASLAFVALTVHWAHAQPSSGKPLDRVDDSPRAAETYRRADDDQRAIRVALEQAREPASDQAGHAEATARAQERRGTAVQEPAAAATPPSSQRDRSLAVFALRMRLVFEQQKLRAAEQRRDAEATRDASLELERLRLRLATAEEAARAPEPRPDPAETRARMVELQVQQMQRLIRMVEQDLARLREQDTAGMIRARELQIESLRREVARLVRDK